jgi:chromosomal replication initiator protein
VDLPVVGGGSRAAQDRDGLTRKDLMVWSAALGELQLQMTQATFDTWLRDSRLLSHDEGVWTIGVKTGYAKDWLEHRLMTTIHRQMARLTRTEGVEVRFVVMDEAEE